MVRLLVLVNLPVVFVSILSNMPSSAYSSSQIIPNPFIQTQSIMQPEAYIWVNSNPVPVGNIQTITFGVFDLQSGQGIPGVTVDGTITYAPGVPVNMRSFTGNTDNAGYFYYSWVVDPQPGFFIVTVAAVSEQYSIRLVKSTMFEVTA
jgi:hypothetical protein